MADPVKKFIRADVEKWFDDKVLPMRTASAGFSLNRIIEGPKAIFFGNAPNANGLCGGASFMVSEEFFKEFGGYTTSDNLFCGTVLWDGMISNHMANILLLNAKKDKEEYTCLGKPKAFTSNLPVRQYSDVDLMALGVLDLYYKKRSTLDAWWLSLASGYGGKITIGKPWDF